MRSDKTAAFIALCVVAEMAGPGPAQAFEDPADQDLGFASLGTAHPVGYLCRRAFSPQDADASLIINNVPLYYSQPRLEVSWNEGRVQLALDHARSNSQHDWKTLALVLEDAAVFYRKLNRVDESLGLLQELIELTKDNNPASDDVCNAQIACAQTACAAHRYRQSEYLLGEALHLAESLHGRRHPLSIDIRTNLYYLYFDTGQDGKALVYRCMLDRLAGYDAVADSDSSMRTATDNTWPTIIRNIDMVATANDMKKLEKAADAEALAALKRRAGDSGQDGADDPDAKGCGDGNDQQRQAKDKGKKKKPPVPYRLPNSWGIR